MTRSPQLTSFMPRRSISLTVLTNSCLFSSFLVKAEPSYAGSIYHILKFAVVPSFLLIKDHNSDYPDPDKEETVKNIRDFALELAAALVAD